MNWRRVSGFLGLLVVASLVALVIALGDSDDPASALARAEAEAEAAARTSVVAMTTYDWTSVDEDFSWVETGGTAKFQEYYAEISAPIREVVTELKAHAEGTVVDAAARAESADRVVVLLFVDQTLTDQAQQEKRLDQPRITMTMVREGGRWLVDEVAINNLTTS